MDVSALLIEIDTQIAALEAARAAVAAINGPVAPAKRGPGRPAGVTKTAKRIRVMSPEGRAAVADAQRLRWAKVKRAAKKASKATATV